MPTSTIPHFISNQVVDGKYFILDPDASDQVELSIICAGKESCGERYAIDRKCFKYYAIEFIASGKCEIIIDGVSSEVGAGNFFVYGPNTPHTIRSIGSDPLVKYFVDFIGTSVPSALEEHEIAAGSQFYVGNRRWVQGIFEQLLECSQHSRVDATSLGLQLLKLLFVRLSMDRQKLNSVHPHSNVTFSRCWEYISNNYINVNTVDEITKACNVDGAYLTRLFRRYAQETPYQLLTRLKIGYAADMILRENISVKELGQLVGYNDPYHFSRVFKRVVGLSPKSYSVYIQRGQSEKKVALA